ncbi:hypothetical protein ACHAWT_005032 [Skeletonema menzelii]
MPQLSIATTIALLYCCCSGYASAFIAPPSSSSSAASISQTSSHNPATALQATRRNFLTQSIATSTTAALILTSSQQPAFAKETIEVTPELVTESFAAIRNELTSPNGVVSTLSNLIDNGSFEDILQYTKESDAYFRKAKLGKARKLLTDKDLKGEAVLMSNAVTFDLIGINRASRPGKESREDQLRYLEELKKDIEKFLELEKTIVFE